VVVGAVVTGAAVIPAFLGFAAPVQRGAIAVAWMKSIAGVLICGALLAFSNWIYTLCTMQWAQTGLPALPPLAMRPGTGEAPVGIGGLPNNTGSGSTQRSSKASSTWLAQDEYRD
jgi:hypothetical protein